MAVKSVHYAPTFSSRGGEKWRKVWMEGGKDLSL